MDAPYFICPITRARIVPATVSMQPAQVSASSGRFGSMDDAFAGLEARATPLLAECCGFDTETWWTLNSQHAAAGTAGCTTGSGLPALRGAVPHRRRRRTHARPARRGAMTDDA